MMNMKKFVNVVSLIAIGVIITSIGCGVRRVDAFVNENHSINNFSKEIDMNHLCKDNSSSQNDIQPEEISPEGSTLEGDGSENTKQTYKNIEEMFQNHEFDGKLKQLEESYAKIPSTSYTMNIYARDNCLIIAIQMKDIPYSEDVAKKMKSSIDFLDSIMTAQAEELQPYVEDAHPTIEIIFMSNDDKELAHGIFTTDEPYA